MYINFKKASFRKVKGWIIITVYSIINKFIHSNEHCKERKLILVWTKVLNFVVKILKCQISMNEWKVKWIKIRNLMKSFTLIFKTGIIDGSTSVHSARVELL